MLRDSRDRAFVMSSVGRKVESTDFDAIKALLATLGQVLKQVHGLYACIATCVCPMFCSGRTIKTRRSWSPGVLRPVSRSAQTLLPPGPRLTRRTASCKATRRLCRLVLVY